MPYLLLHDRQWNLLVNNIRHEVTVPQAMNRERLQVSSLRIFSIYLLQSGLGDIMLKYLPDAILREWPIPAFSGVK